ncbi:MAG: hypothetical protein II869_06750 [Synergistaceae bacterium]|nr:hypothetical protein [Synergistaceae bacterium]
MIDLARTGIVAIERGEMG